MLIVDDNRDAADSVAMLLELEGHQVKAVYDGRSALSAAADFRPEVVLLDLGLPDIDGYSLAAKLREQDQLRAATMIALTGYGQADDRRRTRSAGFEHHLVKSPEIDELLAIVSRS